ncbi:hypothetical protein EYC84_009158 [Monilinia fructicola]|uniref:Rad54 N-terminal domain-containing protein n=1 Tax=Monilinia fructicola TaxID=38448 RepID=A0A5M9JE39_MONFR|nr:hypothetical protein EYC84_009158 [Monilinia fructicola]
MITPPSESESVNAQTPIPLAGKKRVGLAETPQSANRLKQPFQITLGEDKENTPPATQRGRLYGGTPQSVDKLIKPFRCPGSATMGEQEDGDKPWTNEDRLALANRDANKFPVFQVKDKDAMFKKRFSVPLINKDRGGYNPNRPPPTLGLRQGAVFVAKALHDPSGEFAIVLYDPTIDEKPRSIEQAKKEEEDAKKEDAKGDEPQKSVVKTGRPIGS